MKCSNCGTVLKDKSKFCQGCGSEIIYESGRKSFARPPETYKGPKKLYRSQKERMIAGVCGGLAEYFDTDVTLVRVVFVLLTLAGLSGILLYLILLAIIPETPLEPWAQPGSQSS